MKYHPEYEFGGIRGYHHYQPYNKAGRNGQVYGNIFSGYYTDKVIGYSKKQDKQVKDIAFKDLGFQFPDSSLININNRFYTKNSIV